MVQADERLAVARELKALRKRLGLSQEKCSELIGCSLSSFSRVERAVSSIRGKAYQDCSNFIKKDFGSLKVASSDSENVVKNVDDLFSALVENDLCEAEVLIREYESREFYNLKVQNTFTIYKFIYETMSLYSKNERSFFSKFKGNKLVRNFEQMLMLKSDEWFNFKKLFDNEIDHEMLLLLNNYFIVMFAHGERIKAVFTMEKLLETVEKSDCLQGKEFKSLAVMYNNFAYLNIHFGKYKEAEESIKKAWYYARRDGSVNIYRAIFSNHFEICERLAKPVLKKDEKILDILTDKIYIGDSEDGEKMLYKLLFIF
ncbi:MAG: helix-turn-helix domain-containing protein [Lachnospiraceae bacterium]|nr:helix-turn-helix domain-containing protein [Lachnospiraceae bacterium]